LHVPHRSTTLPSSVDWLDDIHSHIVGAREAFGDEKTHLGDAPRSQPGMRRRAPGE
jgi:hypothetical protein